MLLALVALCGLDAALAENAKDNANRFVEALSQTCDVQEGHFEYMDTIALSSQGKLISCFGNNAGSGYLVPMIPPAEAPSALYDPSAENAPANPYFSPVGWTYKLRQDEAVVLVGTLPPVCKYYFLINYVFASAVKPGKTYTERSFFKFGSAESGVYHPVFASMRKPVNMNNIRYAGDSCFGGQFAYIAAGNQDTAQAVRAALIGAGYDEKMINIAPFYADTLRMGLEKGADVFSILMRTSQLADEAAFDQWLTSLSETMSVYRVTPKTETSENAYANPTLTPRGIGMHEVQTLPQADKALDTIRQNLIAQYAGEYDDEERTARIAVPEGMTGYLNDENAQGDNRDTSYLMTDDFTLDSDEDFVVVYGVNHVSTGKATYANTVLYARPMLNGIVSLYDSMYADSASAYLPGAASNSYYVMKLARTAQDAYTASIPYSTDNPNGRFYGADNGTQLFLAYRAYVEPETGVGPSYYEIVYDRAIIFHKK